MSVIVKGMEMPKSCFKCDINCKEFYASDGLSEFFAKRLENCPLVEIPEKHGRLIDADAIDYDDYFYNKGVTMKTCKSAQKIIDEQPTIVESEE